MTGRSTFVIVGAGLGGSVAAETLRAEGFDGRVVVVGDEPHLPYSKPPLSKGVLRGEQPPDEAQLRTHEWYKEDDIELRLGVRARSVDVAAREVELADDSRIPYDKVLLVTGGACRTLPVPGADLDGVFTLRTLDDSLAIKERLVPGAPIVVIGAGFIGAEVAASAQVIGCDVTVLEVADVPLSRVLGPEVGHIYSDIHRERGVNLRTGASLERIEGDGQVRRVVASDGRVHEAVAVVIGVGIEPDLGPVRGSQIAIGNGIVVNELCEASVDDVYAAGDVALHPNPILGRTIRIEQWQNAQHQAAAAARNMLGAGKPFAEVPWFWSDQYDLNLQMAGLPSSTDEAVFRGDVDGRSFSVFYLRDGVLEGVVGVNRVRDVRTGRRLIQQHVAPDRDALADESVDLGDLSAN
jgi:3-phenylpropionate/trans-cinnamate dioxygenase ferredoxin reductase component